MAAGIAVHKAIKADLNARPSCAVFQRIDPIAIDLSLFDAYAANVADGLHSCQCGVGWLYECERLT
jgi:hypothetical protein